MHIVFILQKVSKHATVLQLSQGEYEFEKKGSLSIVRPPQTDETLTSQKVNGNAGAAPSLPGCWHAALHHLCCPATRGVFHLLGVAATHRTL